MNRLLYLSLLMAIPLQVDASQFLEHYKQAVDTKDTNKLLATKKPIENLSYDIVNQWKVSAGLLLTDVKNDDEIKAFKDDRRNQNLADLAKQLKDNVDKLHKACLDLVEHGPVAFYKKPLFGKAKYNEVERDAAKARVRGAKESLLAAEQGLNKVKFGIAVIADLATSDLSALDKGQRELVETAQEFAKKMSDIATALYKEVNEKLKDK